MYRNFVLKLIFIFTLRASICGYCCLMSFALLFVVLPNTQLRAQNLTTPKEHFGFAIGDDYQLANYTQTEAYFKKLAAESDRVILQEIGKTEEGRSQYVL